MAVFPRVVLKILYEGATEAVLDETVYHFCSLNERRDREVVL